MTRRKTVSILSALLWTAPFAYAAAAVLRLYAEGAARRAAGDALTPVFTPAALGSCLLPAALLLAAAAGLTFLLRRIGAEPGPGKTHARGRVSMSPPPAAGSRRTAVVRTVLLAAALLLIAAGVLNGGLRDVLIKATNLCTECVGLG